ncbi:MAG: AAA family ATPase [Zestosphaera sp.]
MRVLGIRLVNVRTYRDSTIVIPYSGVTIIHGENGSGKTSIFMALQYAFFGSARKYGGRSVFRGFSDPTVNDLLRTGTARGYVRVLFEQAGKVYLLERTLSSTGQFGGYLVECSFTEEVVKCPAQRIPLNTEALNQRILSVLGLADIKGPRDLFTSTVYVPQFNIHEILTLSNEERRELLNAAFSLGEYTRVYKNMERLAGSGDVSKPRRDSVIGSEIYVQKQKVEELRRRYDKLDSKSKMQRVKELDEEIPEIEKRLKAVEAEMQGLNEKIKKLNEESVGIKYELNNLESVEKLHDELLKNKKSYEKELNEFCSNVMRILELEGPCITVSDLLKAVEDARSEMKKRLSEIEDGITSLRKKLNLLRDEKSKRESEKSQLAREEGELTGHINSLRESLRTKEEEYEGVRELVSRGVCPKCRQKIMHEHGVRLVKEVEESIKNLNNDIESLTQELEEVRGKLSRTEELLKQTEEEIATLQKELDSLEDEKSLLNEKLNNLSEFSSRLKYLHKEVVKVEEQLRGLPDVAKRREELQRREEILKDEIGELNAELKSLEVEKEKLVREKAEKEAERKRCEDDIKEAEEISVKLDTEESRLETLTKLYSFVGSRLGDIVRTFESTIKNHLLDAFKTKLREYYDVIFGVQGFEVDVDSDFRPALKDAEGRELTQPSGAQITALALAYRLALNNVVRSVNKKLEDAPLILDEPTLGFDSEHVTYLAELLEGLKGLRNGGVQVIVVTHAEELLNAGDCRIRLKTKPERPAPNAEVSEIECMDSGIEGLPYQDYQALVRTILMS